MVELYSDALYGRAFIVIVESLPHRLLTLVHDDTIYMLNALSFNTRRIDDKVT